MELVPERKRNLGNMKRLFPNVGNWAGERGVVFLFPALTNVA